MQFPVCAVTVRTLPIISHLRIISKEQEDSTKQINPAAVDKQHRILFRRCKGRYHACLRTGSMYGRAKTTGTRTDDQTRLSSSATWTSASIDLFPSSVVLFPVCIIKRCAHNNKNVLRIVIALILSTCTFNVIHSVLCM